MHAIDGVSDGNDLLETFDLNSQSLLICRT